MPMHDYNQRHVVTLKLWRERTADKPGFYEPVPVELTLSIDTRALAETLGLKAYRNTRKVSRAMKGAVVVKVKR